MFCALYTFLHAIFLNGLRFLAHMQTIQTHFYLDWQNNKEKSNLLLLAILN